MVSGGYDYLLRFVARNVTWAAGANATISESLII